MSPAVRLSARRLIAYAILNMVRRFRTLVGLCAPGLLIVLAAGLIGRFIDVPEDGTFPPSLMALIVTASLAANVAMVPAFTGWHRLLLQPNPGHDGGKRLYGWDAREWRYFRILMLLWAAMMAINIIGSMVLSILGEGRGPAVIMSFLTLTAYIYAWARIGLVLPPAALGHGRTIREMGEIARGNVGAVAYALAGIWFLITLFGVALVVVMSALGAALGGSLLLVLTFVIGFYYLALVASVGVLSAAYAELTA